MNKEQQENLLELNLLILQAVKVTKVPANQMPELAQALFMLDSYLRYVYIDGIEKISNERSNEARTSQSNR